MVKQPWQAAHEAHLSQENEPLVDEFQCSRICTYKEEHSHLPYCPDEIAEALVDRLELDAMGIPALSWRVAPVPENFDIEFYEDLIRSACNEGGPEGFALAQVAEGGQREAEYLLALHLRGFDG